VKRDRPDTSPPVADDRLRALLEHLSDNNFRSPPRNVGLKTMISARDAGLIELGPNLRKPSAQLTDAGRARRECRFKS
jgi:hypothetical protein